MGEVGRGEKGAVKNNFNGSVLEYCIWKTLIFK